jgi:hypothetical protein
MECWYQFLSQKTNALPVEFVVLVKGALILFKYTVDTSGSMGSYATLKNGESEDTEFNGLTVLDIVKHSIKTIISALDEKDQLAIVEFNSKSNVVFALSCKC